MVTALPCTHSEATFACRPLLAVSACTYHLCVMHTREYVCPFYYIVLIYIVKNACFPALLCLIFSFSNLITIICLFIFNFNSRLNTILATCLSSIISHSLDKGRDSQSEILLNFTN